MAPRFKKCIFDCVECIFDCVDACTLASAVLNVHVGVGTGLDPEKVLFLDGSWPHAGPPSEPYKWGLVQQKRMVWFCSMTPPGEKGAQSEYNVRFQVNWQTLIAHGCGLTSNRTAMEVMKEAFCGSNNLSPYAMDAQSRPAASVEAARRRLEVAKDELDALRKVQGGGGGQGGDCIVQAQGGAGWKEGERMGEAESEGSLGEGELGEPLERRGGRLLEGWGDTHEDSLLFLWDEGCGEGRAGPIPTHHTPSPPEGWGYLNLEDAVRDGGDRLDTLEKAVENPHCYVMNVEVGLYFYSLMYAVVQSLALVGTACASVSHTIFRKMCSDTVPLLSEPSMPVGVVERFTTVLLNELTEMEGKSRWMGKNGGLKLVTKEETRIFMRKMVESVGEERAQFEEKHCKRKDWSEDLLEDLNRCEPTEEGRVKRTMEMLNQMKKIRWQLKVLEKQTDYIESCESSVNARSAAVSDEVAFAGGASESFVEDIEDALQDWLRQFMYMKWRNMSRDRRQEVWGGWGWERVLG